MLIQGKKNRTAETVPSTEVKPSARLKLFFRLDRIGIRRHLVLLILLIFTPLMTIEIIAAVQEYQTQRQQVLNNQAATARSVAQTFTAFINDQINNNRALAVTLRDALSNGNPPGQEQGDNMLASYHALLPLLKSYRVLDLSGKTRYADPAMLVGLDMSNEPGFQQIIAGKETFLSNLRLSEVDKTTPVITIFSAVKDNNGRLVGLITASIDTTKLGNVLNFKLGAKQRGSLTISDAQGSLIYNSQSPQLPYQNRINRQSEAIKTALSGREYLLDYAKSTIDGLEKMGASVPIAQFGWAASVADPIDDAMAATLDNILPRLISFGIVAVFSVLLAWLYSRFLSRPLVELKQAVHRFGQGDLDARVKIPKYAASEIQELSQGFNQMTRQISKETRARDAFLAQASHELKTPLTVIKGTTQILSRRMDKPAAKPEKVEKEAAPVPEPTRLGRVQGREFKNIDLQINRMTELINRLLDLSRLQSGQMNYHFEPVNLLQLIERSIEAASFLTTTEKHPISLNIAEMPQEPGDWLVELDVPRIEQVLLNLLENAIKYSPTGGPITISVSHSSAGSDLPVSGVKIIVQDRGLGVPPADLERLFERYYRVEQTETQVTGLGLGLYIAWQICKNHGGKLWATSPGPGKGSTFYLVLPLKQPQKTLQTEALISSL